MSQNDVQNAQELTEFVKGLLNQMNERFKGKRKSSGFSYNQ